MLKPVMPIRVMLIFYFQFTLPEKKKCMEDYAPLDEGREAHWEVVERILFLYAKLNPGQSYVQVRIIMIFVAHNYNHKSRFTSLLN